MFFYAFTQCKKIKPLKRIKHEKRKKKNRNYHQKKAILLILHLKMFLIAGLRLSCDIDLMSSIPALLKLFKGQSILPESWFWPLSQIGH